jgi:type II secretory pathway pseudopilin PulG
MPKIDSSAPCHRTRIRGRRRAQAGMNLVEVLIALGIMAGVLISVASLFVLGGQRVKGGRNMTQALAVASDILEDLHSSGFNTVDEAMPSCCGAGCDTATGCTVDSRTDAYGSTEWQPWIDQELFQSWAEITLTPLGGSVSPPNFASADGIRVQVEIFWSEGPGQRSVVQETVMF